jgi:hypothetical protein
MEEHMLDRHVKIRKQILMSALIVLALLLCGCHAGIRETHYFQTTSASKPDEPVNFFRLEVEGNATFTNARYVAGFYDERAVDLFFNEIKPSAAGDSRQLFGASLKDPGSDIVLKPLSPGDRGAFVLVLSSNADAIASAIGSFAESQEVANNIATLLNHGDLRKAVQSQTSFGGDQVLATAFANELNTVLDPANLTTSTASAHASMLRALNLIAQSLGAPQSFATVPEVQAWLAVRRTMNNSGVSP